MSAFCSNCRAQARPSDRFCLKCGTEINPSAQNDPVNLGPVEYRATIGSRIGDYVVGNAKGFLIIVGVAVIGGIGALTAKDESVVPEDSSSPGYSMVRHLKESRAIAEFKAITPEDGYDSEYSLNDGDGYIRFKGDGMEYEVPSYEDKMRAKIEAEAERAGFADSP